MNARPLIVLSVVLLILCSLAGAAFAEAPSQPDTPPGKAEVAPPGREPEPAAPAAATAAAPAPAPGGPDDFGYTWSHAIYGWIDATQGTATSITGDDQYGQVNLPFPFKFYGQTWNSAYISTNGFISFKDGAGGCCGGFQMPSPAFPNSVIAAFWDDLAVGGEYNNGAIYTRAGGTAPDRWFVVEWHNATECCARGATDYKTFEIILHENGDVSLQYQTLNGYLQDCTVGVEDDRGLDGLQILRYSAGLYNGKAYQVTRPGPMARVSIYPREAGTFVTAGEDASYTQTVHNIGEVGSDTYDLMPSSDWPVTLTRKNDGAPLIDTNGNGWLDTGPLAEGDSVDVTVAVAAPAGAASGASSATTLTVASSRGADHTQSARFRAAVSATFAASYTRSSKPIIGYYRPGQRDTTQSLPDGYGYEAAAATLPDGKIVQVWYQGRQLSNGKYVGELYAALLDANGNTMRPATRITDLSGTSAGAAYDNRPGVAVASDGRIGVTWHRYLRNNNQVNYNIYFLALNAAGDMVVQPTNITNNNAWGQCCSSSNYVQLYNPTIAAAGNKNYVIAWTRYTTDGSEYASRAYYAVRRPDGSSGRGVTQLGNSDRVWYPNLEPLNDGTALLTYRVDTNVVAARLDGSGNVVTQPVVLAADRYPSRIDAAQLPNGKIALAWTSWSVYRMMLNAQLQVEVAPEWLDAVSPQGAQNLSVTRSGNRAVLVWADGCCNYYPNLYTALLDDAGHTLTPPMIFASDPQSYYLELPYNGQGVTSLIGDTTPPTNPTNLTSPSHTVNAWVSNKRIEMQWTAGTDAGGIGGYAVVWNREPATVPLPVKNLDAVTSATSAQLDDGAWYFHIRAMDRDGNWAAGAAHAGPFKIDTTPPQSQAFAPAAALGPIPVWWSGADAGSGIVSYDILVREGDAGENTRWIANTTATRATYSWGNPGQTIYFWTQAKDAAGNAEPNWSTPDASTRRAAAAVAGRVLNARGQPIQGAVVNTWMEPGVYNEPRSDAWGRYTLFLGPQAEPLIDMSATAVGYGEVAYRRDVSPASQPPDTDFVLPPALDGVLNGGFEDGARGWQNIGVALDFTAEVTGSAARSGHSGLRVLTPAGNATPRGHVSQSVYGTADARALTLSFFYKVVSGNGSDTLLATATDGAAISRSKELPLTPGGWTHVWLDLSGLEGQAFSVDFAVTGAGAKELYIDEVSVGDAKVGSWPVFLPATRR